MSANPQGGVPIISKSGTVTGIWARNPNFTIDKYSMAELGRHAEPLLMTRTHPAVKLRRVHNDHLTVLHNCQFPGGVFIMKNDNLAPSEAMSRGLSEYGVMEMQGGIDFLHATREFTEKAQPV